MTRFLFFTAALAFLLSAGNSTAQQPLTGDLKLVPPDAAIFGYVDVAKLSRSKVAAALREFEAPNEAEPDSFDAKPVDPKGPKTAKPYKDFVKQFQDATGVNLDSIKTLTFYIPKVKGPGDEATFVLAFTLPEYDLTKFLEGLGKINEEFKDFKQVSPGIVEFKNGGMRMGFPSSTQIILMGPKVKSIPTEQMGAGVVSPALQAAASGKTAVLSLNFANFPEEIKGEDVPAELRPFAPLIKSDLNYATFDIEGDSIAASIRVRNDTRAKSIEAEKALSALMMFARIGLVEAHKQLTEETKRNKMLEPIVGLVTNLQDAVKTAKYESDDTEARLNLKMKADASFAGTLLTAVTQARSSASRSVTANNLKQIGLAMHNYASAHNDAFPMAGICDKNGKPLLSWRVAILPYIEQDNLYKQFKLDEPWDSEHNIKLSKYIVKTFTLPTDAADDGKTRFRVFVGGDKTGESVFNFKKGTKFQDITDGTSNTIMVVTAKDKVVWTKPDELTFDPKGDPSSLLYFQNNVTPVSFCDGSVRSIRKGLPAETWRSLVTKNGGEVANIP
ncbi:MAG: DUF1559 domain-containing protein [Gemmataceae bacterium]